MSAVLILRAYALPRGATPNFPAAHALLNGRGLLPVQIERLPADLGLDPDDFDADFRDDDGTYDTAGIVADLRQRLKDLEQLDRDEYTILTVRGIDLYLHGGYTHGDDPSEVFAVTEVPALAAALGIVPWWTARHCAPYTEFTDADLLDLLALGFGSSPDNIDPTLAWVADLVAKVRPSWGGAASRPRHLGQAYPVTFQEQTGVRVGGGDPREWNLPPAPEPAEPDTPGDPRSAAAPYVAPGAVIEPGADLPVQLLALPRDGTINVAAGYEYLHPRRLTAARIDDLAGPLGLARATLRTGGGAWDVQAVRAELLHRVATLAQLDPDQMITLRVLDEYDLHLTVGVPGTGGLVDAFALAHFPELAQALGLMTVGQLHSDHPEQHPTDADIVDRIALGLATDKRHRSVGRGRLLARRIAPLRPSFHGLASDPATAEVEYRRRLAAHHGHAD